jgi:hypothetical protein
MNKLAAVNGRRRILPKELMNRLSGCSHLAIYLTSASAPLKANEFSLCWCSLNPDIIDNSSGRSYAAPLDEILNISLWALDDYFHRAVGEIRHPAPQTKVISHPLCVGPEADTLNVT